MGKWPSESRPWAALYNTARWRSIRAEQLRREPLCRMCREDGGRITPATVADHIKRHEGDEALFWNPANLQSLCKQHHDTSKRRHEARGYIGGCDEQGNPIDPGHRWHAAGNTIRNK